MARIDKRRKIRQYSHMRDRISLGSVKEVINFLGGPVKVKLWWGVGRTTICDMIRNDVITAGHRLQAYEAARMKGGDMQPKHVGLTSWSDLYPPKAAPAAKRKSVSRSITRSK